MSSKTAVLLINLGTPKQPSYRAVFEYLTEFLLDPRVIDYPWIKRQLLVRGIIIPSRLKNSTESYKRIWTKEGSPLLVYGKRVKSLLQDQLGPDYIVDLAMRYQTPSIDETIDRLLQKPLKELIILPLFPQYASATTGSIFEKVFESLKRYPTLPALRFIDHYADFPQMIDAFCQKAADLNLAEYDQILMSFHGLPIRQLKKSNPHCCKANCCSKESNCYAAQCFATASAMADHLRLSENRYKVTFQSRLGREPWLIPFTGETIELLAKKGAKKIAVFCPSFVADCLETLYEIGIEYQELFHRAGGEKLTLIPCPNDSPELIYALSALIKEIHLLKASSGSRPSEEAFSTISKICLPNSLSLSSIEG